MTFGPTILITLFAATLLLSACKSSEESKLDDHPAVQPQTLTSNAAPDPHHKNDYIHGAPLGLSVLIEDVKVKDTIAFQLKKHSRNLDLHSLTNYEAKVTRNDLMMLGTPQASFVRFLNLGGLKLTDQDIEPISSMKLEVAGLEGNRLKDLHALKGMTELKRLGLKDNPINAAGMRVIAGLNELQRLDLQRTTVSDSDLPQLYGLEKLTLVNLGACPQVTQSGVALLRAKLPKCDVGFDTGSNLKYQKALATLTNISASLISQGEYDEADAALVEVISRWEGEPSPPYAAIVRGYHLRARCQQKLNHPRAQVQMLTKCVALYQQHLPDDSMFPLVAYECAETSDQIGDLRTALAMYKNADAFWQRYPPSQRHREQFQETLRRIGSHLFLAKGQTQKARGYFERALRSAEQYTPEDYLQIGPAKEGLAKCDFLDGNIKSAVSTLKGLIQTFKENKKPNHVCSASVMLAYCYLKQGRYQEAEALLKDNLKLSISDGNRGETYTALVAVMVTQKKQAEAEKYRVLLKKLGWKETTTF